MVKHRKNTRKKKQEDFTDEELKNLKRIESYTSGEYTKNIHKKPTAGEQVFINVYCSNGFKEAEAYKIAYPNQKLYAQNARNMLHRPKVRYLIDKKIEEDVMSKVEYTTEEVLKELTDLLEATKDDAKGNLAVRKGAVELLMRYKGMLVEKHENVNETFADFVKKEEARQKAQGSDLKIVEMPKDE